VKKRIYIGEESFERIREDDYFYIDKTLFIKELLENKSKVTLVTRPRRFGKTLNISMLRSFFDINRDRKGLFDGLAIAEHQYICENSPHIAKFSLKIHAFRLLTKAPRAFYFYEVNPG